MAHAPARCLGKAALVGLLVWWMTALCAGEPPVSRSHGPTTAVLFGDHFQWGSSWGGALEAITGPWLQLGEESARPRGYISKIFDGNTGSLTDPTGSTLIFDGPKVVVEVVVPAWRQVAEVDLFVLERMHKTEALTSLVFQDAKGRQSRIQLKRRVLETRERLARVVYVATGLNLGGGRFVLTYENRDFGSAFVAELSLDGMHDGSLDTLRKPHLAVTECPLSARPNHIAFPGWRTRWPHAGLRRTITPRWVYWNKASGPDASDHTMHSLVVNVARTGDRLSDLARGWLVLPSAATGALPLVVVIGGMSQQYAGMELAGLAGEPERAVARRLAGLGMAVLVMESAPAPTPGLGFLRLASHLDGMLDTVTNPGFAGATGALVDRDRLGLWGVEKGAFPAVLAEWQGTRKFAAVALSRIPDHLPGNEEAGGILHTLHCESGLSAPKEWFRRWMRKDMAVWISGRDATVLADLEAIGHETGSSVILKNTNHTVFSAQEIEAVGDFFLKHLGIRRQDVTERRLPSGSYWK